MSDEQAPQRVERIEGTTQCVILGGADGAGRCEYTVTWKERRYTSDDEYVVRERGMMFFGVPPDPV